MTTPGCFTSPGPSKGPTPGSGTRTLRLHPAIGAGPYSRLRAGAPQAIGTGIW